MFGIGFLEICLILVVGLMFYGPQKLPEMMKQAGKLYVQLRRMSNDVKSTMESVIRDAETQLRQEEETLRRLALAEQKNVTPGEPAVSASPVIASAATSSAAVTQSHAAAVPQSHVAASGPVEIKSKGIDSLS